MSTIIKFVGLFLGVIIASITVVLDMSVVTPLALLGHNEIARQETNMYAQEKLDLKDFDNTDISGAELLSLLYKYRGKQDFGILIEMPTESESTTGIKSSYCYNVLMSVEDDDDSLERLVYAPPIVGDVLDTEKPGGVNSDRIINCRFYSRLIYNESDAIVGILFKEKR